MLRLCFFLRFDFFFGSIILLVPGGDGRRHRQGLRAFRRVMSASPGEGPPRPPLFSSPPVPTHRSVAGIRGLSEDRPSPSPTVQPSSKLGACQQLVSSPEISLIKPQFNYQPDIDMIISKVWTPQQMHFWFRGPHLNQCV